MNLHEALASFQAQRDAHERAKQEAIEQCRVANECAAMGRPIGSQWCLSPSNNSATDPGEVGTILGLSGAAGSGGGGELKIEFSKKGTMVVRKEALITVEAWHQYETGAKMQHPTKLLLEAAAAARVSEPQAAAAATKEVLGASPDLDGRTPLHLSAMHGDATTVQLLIAAGASFSANDKYGDTPLGLTTDETCREILEHHAASLKLLASEPSALVAVAAAHCANFLVPFKNDDEKKAPVKALEKAAAETKAPSEAIKLPLRAYELEPPFLWAPRAARTTLFAWIRDVSIAITAASTEPFMHLSDDCQGDVLNFLEPTMTHEETLHISEHWSPNPDVCAWVRGVMAAAVAASATSVLETAARKGDLAVVTDCIKKGADIEVRTQYGFTPLISASAYGQTDTAKVLLDAGADKDAKNYHDTTAIEIATTNDHAAVVEIFVQAGANKNTKDQNGHSLLFKACDKGHVDVAKVLLEAGADTDIKANRDSSTALINAVLKNRTALVELLLQNGANTDVQNDDGVTALIFASLKGFVPIVELLLQASANPDIKNKDGYTALIWASEYGRDAIVERLLLAGADKDTQNKIGWTALMTAADKGHTGTVELLLQAGANKETECKSGKTALALAQEESFAAVIALLKP